MSADPYLTLTGASTTLSFENHVPDAKGRGATWLKAKYRRRSLTAFLEATTTWLPGWQPNFSRPLEPMWR